MNEARMAETEKEDGSEGVAVSEEHIGKRVIVTCGFSWIQEVSIRGFSPNRNYVALELFKGYNPDWYRVSVVRILDVLANESEDSPGE